MSDYPFSTIAVAYRTSVASTTICALEAVEIDVFCPGFHMANTLPHYALAIGGIPINVHPDDEEDALVLLHSFGPREGPRATRGFKGLDGLGWLCFGVSSPWPDLLLKDMPHTWLDTSQTNR